MIIEQSIRIIILLALPLLCVSVFGGLIAGILQSFFRLSESALIYGVKLLCLGLALTVILPTLIESFQGLMVACINGTM
jgi:type III secretory pathway component EscS